MTRRTDIVARKLNTIMDMTAMTAEAGTAVKGHGDSGKERKIMIAKYTCLKCPFCGSTQTRVRDTRTAVEQNAIKRRRECYGCGKRFTTMEFVQITKKV